MANAAPKSRTTVVKDYFSTDAVRPDNAKGEVQTSELLALKRAGAVVDGKEIEPDKDGTPGRKDAFDQVATAIENSTLTY